MKKVLPGLMAAFIAVTAVAFKPASGEPNLQGTVTFHYTDDQYEEADVADKDNWSSTGSSSCSGAANRACRLTVSQSVCNQVGTTWYLNNDITVAPGASATAYVPSTSTAGFSSKIDRP